MGNNTNNTSKKIQQLGLVFLLLGALGFLLWYFISGPGSPCKVTEWSNWGVCDNGIQNASAKKFTGLCLGTDKIKYQKCTNAPSGASDSSSKSGSSGASGPSRAPGPSSRPGPSTTIGGTGNVPPVSQTQTITSSNEAASTVTNSSGVDCNKDRYSFSIWECNQCGRQYNDGECFT